MMTPMGTAKFQLFFWPRIARAEGSRVRSYSSMEVRWAISYDEPQPAGFCLANLAFPLTCDTERSLLALLYPSTDVG